MNPDDHEIDRLAQDLGPLTTPPEDDADLALLLAYHGGTLDAARLPEVEGLLAADPAARLFLEELDEAPSAFQAAWAVKHGLGAVGGGASSAGPTGRGRLLRRVWPAVVALAAAALIYAFIPGQPKYAGPPPPGYALTLVRGDAVDMRGDGGAIGEGPFTIDDGAELSLGLAPNDAPDGPVRARAFVDGADGRLEAAAVQGALTAGGAWRLDARSRALFGARHGPRTLYVAFAFDGAPLDALAGQPLPSTDTDGAIRWMAVRFDYGAEGTGR